MAILKKPTIRTGIMINPPNRTSLASGFWGPGGPKPRMLADQVVERITKSNADFIRMGVVSDLWIAPFDNQDKLPTCSCVKVTNQSADIRCNKCHGLKLIPGYVKWGYNTCFYSAVEVGLTGQSDPGFNFPTSIVKNTSTTLHTLQLATGVLSASFVTPDYAVNNPYSGSFELQTKIYNRAAGNGYSVEWSLDQGTTWLTGDFTKLELSQGTIRFRITLSRQSAANASPQFEILRFRYPIQDEPFIRAAKPMGNRKKKREETGITEEESGLKYWTIPIKGSAQVNGQSVFDKAWLPDSFILLLREGTFAGDRYWTTNIERSEHIGVLTSQWFTVRRVQPNEIYFGVF